MTSSILIRFDFSRVHDAIATITAVATKHPGYSTDIAGRIEDGEQPVVINPNWVVDPTDGAMVYLVEPAPWLTHLASSARAAADFASQEGAPLSPEDAFVGLDGVLRRGFFRREASRLPEAPKGSDPLPEGLQK